VSRSIWTCCMGSGKHEDVYMYPYRSYSTSRPEKLSDVESEDPD
jgi:hypothetical protein